MFEFMCVNHNVSSMAAGISRYLHLSTFLCQCLFLGIFLKGDFYKSVLFKSLLTSFVRAKCFLHSDHSHLQWDFAPLILPLVAKDADFSVVCSWCGTLWRILLADGKPTQGSFTATYWTGVWTSIIVCLTSSFMSAEAC